MTGFTILETLANNPTPNPNPTPKSESVIESVIDLDALKRADWTPEMFRIAAQKMGRRGGRKPKARRETCPAGTEPQA